MAHPLTHDEEAPFEDPLEWLVDRGDQRVMLVAHSDGDGHLAAEQTRMNLGAAGIEVAELVLSPSLTRNYRFWDGDFSRWNLSHVDGIVFVDLMFSPKDPSRSFCSLQKWARIWPNKSFTVVDHHRLIDSVPDPESNIRLSLVDSVYRCCLGGSSDLMTLAAICDGDSNSVKELSSEFHLRVAKGIRRAVTHTMLVGEPTLSLIRARAWHVFEEIAGEPNEFHRTFYGRRLPSVGPSPAMKRAKSIAVGLIASNGKHHPP